MFLTSWRGPAWPGGSDRAAPARKSTPASFGSVGLESDSNVRGILVEESALEQAERKCLADAEVRSLKLPGQFQHLSRAQNRHLEGTARG
jgi:hypothetical protein